MTTPMARTSMEATTARYDGRVVLPIAGRLKLVHDAAVKCYDTPSHCADCDCDGAMHDRCFCRLAGP